MRSQGTLCCIWNLRLSCHRWFGGDVTSGLQMGESDLMMPNFVLSAAVPTGQIKNPPPPKLPSHLESSYWQKDRNILSSLCPFKLLCIKKDNSREGWRWVNSADIPVRSAPMSSLSFCPTLFSLANTSTYLSMTAPAIIVLYKPAGDKFPRNLDDSKKNWKKQHSCMFFTVAETEIRGKMRCLEEVSTLCELLV